MGEHIDTYEALLKLKMNLKVQFQEITVFEIGFNVITAS